MTETSRLAPTVEFDQVTKRFGAVTALSDVSLSVETGEIVAMLGPNGAGKTTATSIMMGLRKPTTGSARLFGLDPRDEQARVRCGVMLQESGVPGFLTVSELIDVFRTFYPAPLETKHLLEIAGLSPQAKMQVGNVSTGQRQRLYFALAIAGDPDVLSLDEPTVGLDVDSRRAFWAYVGEFVDRKRTVLFTTHYLEEADAQARRIVVIDKGQILADASPATLKARVTAKRVSFALDRALTPVDTTGLPIGHIESAPGRTTLFTTEPEAVLRALFGRDVPLRELEVSGASLEEALQNLSDGKAGVS